MMHKNALWYGLIFLISLPTAAFAGSTTLKWKANSEPDLSGYNVYCGTKSRNYGAPIPVGKVTSYKATNLQDGLTYYYAVTAVDSSGNESGYSTEVSAASTSSGSTTPSGSTEVAYQLMLSTNAYHSNSVPLNGRTVSGTVYIFLSPEANISQVVFNGDGKTLTDSSAPYDFGGPVDTTSLTNGQHTISARITLQDNSLKNISANLNISNGTSSTPATAANQPNKVGLTRTPSGKLPEGSTVRFTASASGGSGNYQYKFMERGPATNGVWVVARDYSTSAVFDWNSTSKAGTTRIQAWARNVGASIDIKPKKVKTIKVKVVKPKTAQAGQAATSTTTVNNTTTNTPNSLTYWLDEPGGK